MMSQTTSDWCDEPRAAWWPHREQRSGLSGFGGRPVLHQAWRDPVPDFWQARRERRDAPVIELARFRSAA